MKAEKIIEIGKLIAALLPLAEAIVKMIQRLVADDGAGGAVKHDIAVKTIVERTGASSEDASMAVDIAVDLLKATDFEDAYGTKFRRKGATQ